MNPMKIKQEMKNALPPYQPWVKFQTTNYQEKIIKLNPVSMKSNGFFYQFTVRDDIVNRGLIVADQCDKLIFKCDFNKPTAHFVGASDAYTSYDFEPGVTYFVIEPYSNFGLKELDATPKELRSQFPLSDLINIDELVAKIASDISFEERVTIFQTYYLNNLVNYDYLPSIEEFTASIVYINRLDFSMNDISSKIGYSKRYLNILFNSEYNMTPGKYARVAKFQDSLRALVETDGDINMADIASRYGYYDESHLSKDYKKFAGLSPKKMWTYIHEI